MQIQFIYNIFKGLKVGVIFLLFQAVITLSKNIKKNILSISLFVFALTINILFTVFNVPFSSLSIVLIVLGIIIGIINQSIKDILSRRSK